MACIFLFLEKNKINRFWPNIVFFAWAKNTRKSAILQWEFNRENLAYIFCFWRKRKKNEAVLTKSWTFSLLPNKSKKVLFYNGNSTGKIWHTFSCCWRNKAILNKNRKFSLGPKKLEKVLCYNWNSIRKIWDTFSCCWRKRKENEAILARAQNCNGTRGGL